MRLIRGQYTSQQASKGTRSRGALPVANTEPSDTVRHLDDNQFATALHLTRLALPDLDAN